MKSIDQRSPVTRDTLLPVAQQRFGMDFDDGVNVNNLNFGDALAPIAGLAAKED